MRPGVLGGGALQHGHGVRHAVFKARHGGAGVAFDGAAHAWAFGAAPLGRHRLVVGVEEAQCARCVILLLVGAQLHGVEAAAAQQRQHVGQHLAAGHDRARVAQRPAQQHGLRIGAAVGPLGELQHHAGVAPDLVARASTSACCPAPARRPAGWHRGDELHGGSWVMAQVATAVLRRTASAAWRKGRDAQAARGVDESLAGNAAVRR
jgi:hypothetical protein